MGAEAKRRQLHSSKALVVTNDSSALGYISPQVQRTGGREVFGSAPASTTQLSKSGTSVSSHKILSVVKSAHKFRSKKTINRIADGVYVPGSAKENKRERKV